jgi:hypothetical protein
LQGHGGKLFEVLGEYRFVAHLVPIHAAQWRCGSAADVHASLLAGTAARCSRLMDWREAPARKRMAIGSAVGSARSVRANDGVQWLPHAVYWIDL